MAIRFAYNARYAKSRRLVGDGKLNCSQLIGGDGREGAACRNLLDCALVVTQKVKQKSRWHVGLWRQCRKSAPNANLAVGEIHDANRRTDTYQNIAGLRFLRRRIRFRRGHSEREVAEVNLPLVKFHAGGFIERIAIGRLPHV